MSKPTTKANFIFRLAGLVVFLVASMSTRRLAIASAQANLWSPAERVPGYDDDARTPYLVADGSGTVHAFNNQEISGERLIVYSQWTLEHGWTMPLDILLSPLAHQARFHGAFLDRTGMMHVVFFGGDEVWGGDIYYSRALAVEAGSARAWSPPIPVGEDAQIPDSAALAGDDAGNLFILYSGGREGLGLYALHSPDAGHTWSEPVPVFLTDRDAPWPYAIRADMDGQGRLHVVWAVMNAAGNGEAVYYARLEADHVQWSTPIVLAERDEGDYSACWPSIIARHGELFVIYQDGPTPPTKWFRRSSDGGETWTDPVRPFPHEGELGHAVLLVDSSGTLHMILGNRIRHVTFGMWHSVWESDHWSDLQAIVSGPLSLIPAGPQAPDPSRGFHPCDAQAVISQGNVLLATWRNDHGFNGAQYSYAILDAPRVPVVVLPTATASPTPTATATPLLPTTTPSPEPTPAHQGDDSPMVPVTGSPAGALIPGVLPVVLLLSAVIALHGLRRWG